VTKIRPCSAVVKHRDDILSRPVHAHPQIVKRRLCLGALLVAILPSAGLRAQRPATAAPVTFARDIAPIVYSQCASCHRPDGPAPFSLLTYDDVRQRAAQIAAVSTAACSASW